MGRRKTIDREGIMLAIEAVVKKHGAAALTIEAVAREAGISKSSVLYDFSTKTALITAYVEHKLARQLAERQALADQTPERPDVWLHGLLSEIEQPPSQDEMSCAFLITASLETDGPCHGLVRALLDEEAARIRDQAAAPRRATIAWLALQGVRSLEYLGLHHFDPSERQEILNDIRDLIPTPETPGPLAPTPAEDGR